MSDVSTEIFTFKVDGLRPEHTLLQGLLLILAIGGDADDTAAIGHDLTVLLRRARMEDDALRIDLVDVQDRESFLVAHGVTAGYKHHTDG